MDLSTKDIIKILPFEKTFKDSLLDRYDSLDEDQRFSIERLVWDLYDALYELRLETNLNIALENATSRKDKLDEELYKRVREQTEKEMLTSEVEEVKTVDLEHTREQLEELLTKKTS